MKDYKPNPSDDSSSKEDIIINPNTVPAIQINTHPNINTVVEGNVVAVLSDCEVAPPQSELRIVEEEDDEEYDSNNNSVEQVSAVCDPGPDDPLKEVVSADQAHELSRTYCDWHERKGYKQDFISPIWRAFNLPGIPGCWSSLNQEQYIKVLELLNGN